MIVVIADFRFTRAFPVLMDGSDLDRQYTKTPNAFLLQSVAASTMSAISGLISRLRPAIMPSRASTHVLWGS